MSGTGTGSTCFFALAPWTSQLKLDGDSMRNGRVKEAMTKEITAQERMQKLESEIEEVAARLSSKQAHF